MKYVMKIKEQDYNGNIADYEVHFDSEGSKIGDKKEYFKELYDMDDCEVEVSSNLKDSIVVKYSLEKVI